MKKTLTIIDTFGFLFRSYYALPPLKSKTGFPTGMLTGFVNLIANIGKDFQTDYLVFALDSKGDTFRKKIYNEYKSHRPDVPEDLLRQLPVVISFIEKMGFASASKIGYEADDIIASLAVEGKKEGLNVRIVSHDKDLYQLIGENITMFDPMKKKNITDRECFEKYGVHPNQFIDYQSLLGDSADNVPGVKGVGAKTAEALIKQFGTLDEIYNNIKSIEKPRWQKLLIESKELCFISKQLVTLHTDAYSLLALSEMELPKENPILKIASILQDYDMHKIIDKVHKDGTSYKTVLPKDYEYKVEDIKETIKCEYIVLNDEKKLLNLVSCISKNSIVAFDTETTGLDSSKAQIVGFSFCIDEKKAYYVPIKHFYLGVPKQVSMTVANKTIEILNTKKLVLQNFKYDFEIIKNNFGIRLQLYADTMIMAWLLNSEDKVGLDKLSYKYFDHTMILFKDIVKKDETFADIDVQKASQYAGEDAWITYRLYKELSTQFEDNKTLLKIAFTIEFPFVLVLNNMENNGIKVDINLLEELKNKGKIELDYLANDIYKLTKMQFNINSPKQLGEVLFDTLGLSTPKKTKTGYSTNEAVLLKLKDEHPVVNKLLEYRSASKLYSTYIEPLIELGNKEDDNRIHTSFLQTGTATGRLSSKNPNLQNIPVRSSAGREIRSAFVARSGYKLVGIDYSQIELRLLAHFSCDPTLVDAFNNKIDIHYQTAVTIFGEEEANKKRNIAKTINFGLIYGMGAKKLGETLSIPTKEAKSYIDSYFENFSTVKNYLKSIQDDAMEHNEVKTLIGRHRHFDFASANGMIKATYLREAVNTVFQGSASDLVKLSMNKIYEDYKTNEDVKILLQIHDELIFEIKEEKVNEITKDLANTMKNIFTLKVPLDVNIAIGNNWGELK
ncbi:DNA polymerase I [hydrothermal vent metagenome]|uniref:DNA-directed DNA polymerase n=1 Tax=hydrothermal vent metagenome TaxID=652676 RepID=A0A3B1E989_9ZZZZ